MRTRFQPPVSLPPLSQVPDRSSWLPLSEAPDGSLSAPLGAGVSPDAARVLIIDLASLPDGAPRNLQFGREDQLKWLARAAGQNATLVVLQTDDRIELYSTEGGHRRAFRSAIHALSARVCDNPPLGLARTLEFAGDNAVRHLLRRAAGLEPESVGKPQLVGQIQAAAAVSSGAAALGSALSLLFRSAANVGRRVRQETAFGNPEGTFALREVEYLAADRILEEEFAAWQAATSGLRRALARENLAPQSSRPFMLAEPGSCLRVLAPVCRVRSGDS